MTHSVDVLTKKLEETKIADDIFLEKIYHMNKSF